MVRLIALVLVALFSFCSSPQKEQPEIRNWQGREVYYKHKDRDCRPVFNRKGELVEDCGGQRPAKQNKW